MACHPNDAMSRSPRVVSLLPHLLTLLIALACALLVALATTWGPWGYSDSAAYVATARNLAAGLGPRLPDAAGVLHPNALTPPFYSIVLALGAAGGLDPLGWARVLNILLAFLFPAAFGLLAARAGAQPWLGPLLAALFACFPALFANAASAMSEQLFLCLGFSGLLLLISDRPVSPRRLFLSAGLVGLAALTRYAGAAFVLAAVILVWLGAASLPSRRRWGQAALYALGASLPLLLWLGWTLLTTRTLGARSLALSAPLLAARWAEFSRQSLEILAAWIPYGARGAAFFPAQAKLLAIFLLWAAAAAWGWRAAPTGLQRLLLAALVFGPAYLLILALSYLLADIPPDLIPRMYSPLWPAFGLALAAAAQALALRLRHSAPPWARIVPLGGLFLIVLVNVLYFTPQIAEMIERGRREGVGYTARVWRESPVFARIRAGLGGRPIISDEPALVLLYTGRGAYPWEEWVQGSLSAAASQPPPGQGAGRLHDLMRSGAALVLFPPRVEEEYGPESRALLESWTMGLEALYRGSEAEILVLP